MTYWTVTILVGIAIAIGVAGVVVPLLPGIWLIWGAALVYGLATGFTGWAWIAMAIITVLAGIGTAAVIYLPARKTTEIGISRGGQLLIAGFSVAGFFIVPIVGAFLGLAVGTLVVSMAMERNVTDAFATAWVAMWEMLKGAAIQLAVALAMAFVWGAWAFTVLEALVLQQG